VAAPAAEATATLDVGAIAPDFGLVAADGATLRLADAVATGPVVVVFYRGDW
jgi:peroxiredoxin